MMPAMAWPYFVLILLSLELAQCAMTEAQIKSTQKLIKRSCKTKMKITNDDELDGMLQGKWDNLSQASKCYLHCCLGMIKMINSDGYLDLESGMAQATRLPPERRASAEKAMQTCVNAGAELTDKCEIAYNICKCVYDFDSKYYIIP
ncbi:PBP/GOBP family [Popillia japonica]|uniref:PBP/GOBP family n=1 Tax=Popillia japonica TaxID=7064 RepID=A0AAW1LUS5_POPJA